MAKELRTFEGTGLQAHLTWAKIREQLQAKYGHSYTERELRDMELKWKRIFIEAGWDVRGQ